MNIREKLSLEYEGLLENGPITIVAFGDSVTHGMLLDDVNYETVYWNILRKKLNSIRGFTNASFSLIFSIRPFISSFFSS